MTTRALPRRLSPRIAAALALALVASACASGGAAVPADSDGGPAVAVEEQVPGDAGEVACAPIEGPVTDVPGWPLVLGAAEGQFLPVVTSQLLTVGPSRFLYSVLDGEHEAMAAPERDSSIAFYAIERDPEVPVATVEAAYLDTGLGRGLYRASIAFDCPGEWGAEVTLELDDGSVASERMRFQVHAAGTTPGIGDPAPRSDSLTASTPEEVALISTDADPYLPAYERTVGEVVGAGQPSLVFFATPAFCQTGYCGPTVELVKSVAREFEGQVGFVNVEPYALHMTENGLQPLLDEDGRLQPVEAVVDYGIPVEPYLFLVDAEGDVFARFEGVVAADELRAAIRDVLEPAV